MVVDDEIAPTQPGYWSNPEQIARVRAAEPPPVEGEGGRPVRRGADPRHAREPLQAPLRRDAALSDPRLPAPARQRRAAARHRLQLGALDDRGGAARLPPDRDRPVVRGDRRRASDRAPARRRRRALRRRRRAASCRSRTARSTSSSRTASCSTSRSPTSRSRSSTSAACSSVRRLLVGADAERARCAEHRAARAAPVPRGRRVRGALLEAVRSSKRVFGRIGPTELSTDGFFTLNPQKRDLDLLPPRFRALVRVSEGLEGRARADDARGQREHPVRSRRSGSSSSARATGARCATVCASRGTSTRSSTASRVLPRRRGGARRTPRAASVEQLPPPVREGIDPFVQEVIGATCGRLYEHLIADLPEYPIPELRLPPGEGRSFLEVGSNWGRWCVAAARRGYAADGDRPVAQGRAGRPPRRGAARRRRASTSSATRGICRSPTRASTSSSRTASSSTSRSATRSRRSTRSAACSSPAASR